MATTASLTADSAADASPGGVGGETSARVVSNGEAKKRLNAFKALGPLLEAVIADPGTGASHESKSECVGRLLASTHKHLPEVAGLVGADSAWSVALVASLLNTMAKDSWRSRRSPEISEAIGLLREVAATRSFVTFSQEIGALDWNHQINDPLDGITAMRITALNASKRFIECVEKFDFMQEDKSEIISRLLALSHKLAFSVEDEVRNMSPHIAINWRRSLLDRASAIVGAEYDRIADFNLNKLESMLGNKETQRYENFKSKMAHDFDSVLGVIEKYAQMSFATLLKSSNAYMDMLNKIDLDQSKASESPANKGV